MLFNRIGNFGAYPMALSGIRVIELAGLAPVPLCGMILADFGANVVRVDRTNAAIDVDRLCRGKRSLALNLKSSAGASLIKRMCRSSDVLIDPFRPGIMEKFGLSPAQVHAENPRLIYARLTGFGQAGPYSKHAGHDINYLAVSGILSMLGRKGEKPLAPVNLLADFAGGGLVCALGILLALFERTRSGLGQTIDASMVEGAAYVASWLFSSQNLDFVWGKPRGDNLLDSGFPLYDTYECKDGKFVAVGALEPEFQLEFLQKAGMEFFTLSDVFEKRAEVREKLSASFKEKTVSEWIETFDGSNACVTPVVDLQDAAIWPHNLQRQSFRKIGDANFEPNPAPRLSRTPGKASGRNELLIGEHTEDILNEFGYTKAEIEQLFAEKTVESADVRSKL